ncbi:acid protease [Lichtheimia hyalospora FSU 10163]|nr:acid protease [Lichtheimia hyalospora FSU 10163]
MRQSLIWAAVVYLTASTTVFADPITIPLFRRHNNEGFVKADAEQLDNGVLGGKVLIGTPPQEFTMAFDTNTGYSWVRGSRCKSENCLDRCTYYARRSESAVSTGEKYKVKYGDACVETTVYVDTVEFGGMKIESMPFGGAYRMTGFDHGFDGYFGLGRDVDFNKTTLYSSTAKSLMRRAVLGSSAFVTNAYQQSFMSSAQFGMYVTSQTDNGFDQSGGNNESTSDINTPPTDPIPPSVSSNITGTPTTEVPAEETNDTDGPTLEDIVSGGFGFIKRTNVKEPAGYLVLGGIDKSVIKGDVHYIDLADSKTGSWDVPISLARFDQKLLMEQKKGAVASISTSDHWISMPADQADIYHKVFGGKFQESTQTYKVKCSKIHKMPRLKLYLGDYAVEIPAQYWTRVIDAKRDCCATRIARGQSDRDWILGTAFTNLFYTTFDPVENKIGLALKKGQKDDGLRIVKKVH